MKTSIPTVIRTLMYRLTLIFGFALLLPFISISQTIINSDITTNTTWDVAGSPYQIMTDITILTGLTLTIDPGVTVLCNTDVRIDLQGDLTAIGTATDSIYITSLNEPLIGDIGSSSHYDWDGFYALNNTTIQMAYVQGSLAKRFLDYSTSSLTPSVSLQFCEFVENSFFTSQYNALATSIENCVFEHGNNIFHDVDNLHVDSCLFNNFGDQFSVFSMGDDNVFEYCTFIDVKSAFRMEKDGGGYNHCYFGYENFSPTSFLHASLELFPGTANNGTPFTPPVVQNCSFFTAGAISAQYHSSLTIENNVICPIFSGSGIILYNSNNFPNTLDLSNNCWCDLDSAFISNQIFDSTLLTPAVNVNFLPIDSSCVPTSVYPGDANHDQIANNVDLLPIGLYYGITGPIRAGASLAWTPQPADGWGDTLISTGADIKHVDTDGNGVINDDDTLALNLNYLQTHNGYKTSNTSVDGIPLYLDMPTTAPNPGDTVAIPIMFGTVDTPAVNVYGLSFSIEYDSSIVEEGMTEATFDNSWLGTKGVDLLTIFKDIDTLQQLDFGLVRTDQIDRTGKGQIAEIFVVIDDDIFKKEVPFVLNIVNAYAIDAQEQAIDLDVRPGIASIEEPTNAVSPRLSQALELYPNPAKEEVLVSLDEERIQHVSILDSRGQLVDRHADVYRHSIRIDLGAYSKGLYLIHVQTGSGLAIKKMIVL